MGIPYRDILVYYNYIYIIFIYKIIPIIGPSIGMLESAFEIGFSLPKINPAPLTNREPPFLDTILPLHRLIQTPSMVLGKDLFRKVPSCSIFSLFLMYNPDPINLLTPVFASPVKAPVAKLGRTLERRNFPAVARSGNKAGRNPPSTFIL